LLRSPSREAPAEDEENDLVAPTGRFRIYLGPVAGVGKTCAMLDEGFRRAERGSDVVIGFVETHGRAHTIELLRDLELVARRTVSYRGTDFEEMDLDAILRRKPEVVLVDELAHTNISGAGVRHAKRWEDVIELLEAGVAVITTVNIQHLESLADAVESITGVPVRDRVPDWVVRRADQIELVDSSPAQLRRRMLHGNIYPPETATTALAHVFRTENLTALREVTLRYLADETEEELLEYLAGHQPAQVFETTERIMVAVTTADGTEAVLRRAARMAARARTTLQAVAVIEGETRAHERRQLDALRRLADDLGARWHDVAGSDPARVLVAFAKSHQITQIVLGTTRQTRFEEIRRGSAVQKILREAGDSGIDVHVIARRRLPAPGDSGAKPLP